MPVGNPYRRCESLKKEDPVTCPIASAGVRGERIPVQVHHLRLSPQEGMESAGIEPASKITRPRRLHAYLPVDYVPQPEVRYWIV